MSETFEMDCGDHSCLFAKEKGGVRTNGGCGCLYNAGYGHSVMTAVKVLLPKVKALEAQLAASEAENAGYRAELKGLYVKNDEGAASEVRLREALISGTEGGGVFWRENALAAPPSPGAALFAQMEEALKWIGTANVHVGNDDNGNMFGPPDKVMCRNRALEALAALKAWRDGG